ncbi:GH39 family glycosyl hydrolase [Leptolyngbya ohadii]|uniref:GH39 family glycosyl hydrolase n=1 Tax=Leptolyngbya ohadii TaxID=1962290 RepID=UPI000B59D34F|nr:glycosyl hydrolase [Leptolyngbya ohadii]
MLKHRRAVLLSILVFLPPLLVGFMFGYPPIKQQLKNVRQQINERSLAGVQLKPPSKPIPNTLFSLHALNFQYGATWPTIPFGSWRSWDAAGTWAFVEKNKGEWNFQLLDQYISLAEESKAEVVLVLGLTPRWASARPDEDSPYQAGAAAEPKRIEDWRNYVRQIAMRYKDRVRYYEIWNEPNSQKFYSGSVKQLVDLSREAYQILKSIDPSIKVISPAMSPCCDSFKFLDNYLAEGGGNYADIIGYHFYVAPAKPEAMLPSIEQVKNLMIKHGLSNKPLWNTETGWRIQNRDINLEDELWAGAALSMDEASAYVARAYIISWAAGVERLYWYAWGHRSMGFTDYDGRTPKPVANAFAEVQKWLIGSVLTSCQSDEEGIWICEVRRDRDTVARIIWNSINNTDFDIPAEWNIQQVKTLNGRSYKLSSSVIQISPLPLLLEN